MSTIYNALNQYHVVMEVAPRYWQDPAMLRDIWVSTSGANPSGTQSTNAVAGTFVAPRRPTRRPRAVDDRRRFGAQSGDQFARRDRPFQRLGRRRGLDRQETMVPLAAFASFGSALTPLSVNHQGPFVATTISFNLAPGHALSEAQQEIDDAIADIRMPSTVRGSFAGTAATFSNR